MNNFNLFVANNINTDTFTFFATCPKGFEEKVQEELVNFGVDTNTTELKYCGVMFNSTIEIALKIILHTRLCNRILLALHKFSVNHSKKIGQELYKLPWETIFNINQCFKINSTIASTAPEIKNLFKNPIFISQVTKDGIVDHFMEKFNKRPDIELKDPDVTINVFVNAQLNKAWKNEVSIYLDFAGKNLSNRGYRPPFQKAPLRENLAAYIIKNMELNFKEYFIDGMCGSGTMLIEYLLEKYNIPGQYLNILNNELDLAFEKFLFIKENKAIKEIYKTLKNEILNYTLDAIKKIETDQNLMANDLDPSSISSVKSSLKLARFKTQIKFSNKDIFDLFPMKKDQEMILFCNPPYGKRLGDKLELEDTYYDLGEMAKAHLTNSKMFILTGERELLKNISLKPKFKKILFNGPIECRLALYNLY